LDPQTSRSHRTALGQLFAIWGALPRTVRRYASDFSAVFAAETRQLGSRVAWAAIPAVLALILVVAGWLLLCVATASWIAATYQWRWEMALYLVALVNIVLAVIAALLAFRSLKAPSFPFTTYQIQRLRSNDEPLNVADETVLGNTPSLDHAGPKERALMRSEAELEARISQVKNATPQLLTTPSVIAATAGVGLAFGFLTGKRKTRQVVVARTGTANAPLARQLINVAIGQLSSLAVHAALREFQRRALRGRHDY
jgi:MFS family permease